MQNAPSRTSLVPLKPARFVVEPLVRTALHEDLGHGNDLTTDAIVPADLQTSAQIVARRAGVLAGLDAAMLVFALLDHGIAVEPHRNDGDRIAPGDRIATIRGSARAILTGERTMLNLLGHLSGVATATRVLVDAIAQTHAQIVNTRKTLPGMRVLQRYAVLCGGGGNHRFGLDDAILIKDNHLALAGSIRAAVAAARAHAGHLMKIEVEVDTLAQLHEALAEPIDAVLLDNMPPETLAEAVRIVDGRVLTEASGGITAETVVPVARSGVDLISVGWLTHSAPALDLGLDIALP